MVGTSNRASRLTRVAFILFAASLATHPDTKAGKGVYIKGGWIIIEEGMVMMVERSPDSTISYYC